MLSMCESTNWQIVSTSPFLIFLLPRHMDRDCSSTIINHKSKIKKIALRQKSQSYFFMEKGITSVSLQAPRSLPAVFVPEAEGSDCYSPPRFPYGI